ncbi:MAG: D-2-hydroxyacid dehydrogenase [Ruminococcaceae bacterium]|nr:D-2-hydroxyacid dehydrogenase [Oscillospiraceae bacterium]
MEKTVLCLLPVEERHRNKLEAAGRGCRFVYAAPETVTTEEIHSAEIILGLPPVARMNAPEKLEVLQSCYAGVDPYLKPGVLREGTLLLNSTGAYSQAVAEHGLACTLTLLKKLHLYRDAQRQKNWTDFGTVSSLADATVLVVGLGDIGGYYAALVKALGAYVIGVKRRPSAKPDGVDELYTMEALDELLPRADVIFSVLPGTDATFHMYTAERFERMKNTAVFINCGRGSAVESAVLLEALRSGAIACAAVDVTEPEPLPVDSPLWQLDNLLITPHISGQNHLPVTFERVVNIAAENLRRYLAGEELVNVVDWKTGYKK